MHLGDIHEGLGLLNGGHPQQQAHGDLRRLAMLAREERLVDRVQPDCRVLVAPMLRRPGLPILTGGSCKSRRLDPATLAYR